MSQNEKIIDYMRNHGSIDNKRAVYDLDIMRLGARIYDLKSLGVPIQTETKYKFDEHGHVESKWAEYRLA